jgi:CDP-paratose synthetase
MNKVLLTGASGYLGTRMQKALRGQGWIVICHSRSDLDLTVLEREKINVVVNCATAYGRNGEDVDKVFDANLRFPFRLLSKSLGRVSLFINAGTVLDSSVNAYALAKQQLVQWGQYFSSDIAFVNLSLEMFYGPGQSKEQFIPSLTNVLLSTDVDVPLTSGSQKRNLIHVDDIVSAFIFAMNHKQFSRNGFWNYRVSSFDEMSIRDIAEKVALLCGSSPDRLKFGLKTGRPPDLVVTSELPELRGLGWVPVRDLQEGLVETVEAARKTVEAGVKR